MLDRQRDRRHCRRILSCITGTDTDDNFVDCLARRARKRVKSIARAPDSPVGRRSDNRKRGARARRCRVFAATTAGVSGERRPCFSRGGRRLPVAAARKTHSPNRRLNERAFLPDSPGGATTTTRRTDRRALGETIEGALLLPPSGRTANEPSSRGARQRNSCQLVIRHGLCQRDSNILHSRHQHAIRASSQAVSAGATPEGREENEEAGRARQARHLVSDFLENFVSLNSPSGACCISESRTLSAARPPSRYLGGAVIKITGVT